jgi:pimeloyl-[acyl-carrier protein] methyl ester esterase
MKLVLLPGLDGTGVLFRPLLKALPSNIDPIVVSYPTQEPLGYEQLLSLTLASLPTSEPYVLLGESFGGPLSVRIAASRPSHLRGLILCGSFVTCPHSSFARWSAPLVRSLPFRAFPFALELQRFLRLYETPEHYELGKEAITQVASEVFAHRVREIVRVDVAKELESCSVPLLYMQGIKDKIVRPGNLGRIQKLRPDIQVARIDSGHMILKTRPVESVKVIEDFIETLG